MRALVFGVMMATAGLSGCALGPIERVFDARRYNLSSGEVIPGTARANLAGHSVLTGGPTRSGETFTGEATSIENRVRSSTHGSGVVSGVYSSGYISTSSYSTSTPGYQNGTAILVGSPGTR